MKEIIFGHEKSSVTMKQSWVVWSGVYQAQKSKQGGQAGQAAPSQNLLGLPVHVRLRQEDCHQFQDSLGYRVRPVSNNKKSRGCGSGDKAPLVECSLSMRTARAWLPDTV